MYDNTKNNTYEVKSKLTTHNSYLKDQNNKLQAKIDEIEKLVNSDFEEFSIKEEYYHLVKKEFELDEKIEIESQSSKLYKISIELINKLIEGGKTLNDAVNSVGGVEIFFKVCNFILLENIDKKDELKQENIDLVEKLVYLSEEYQRIYK